MPTVMFMVIVKCIFRVVLRLIFIVRVMLSVRVGKVVVARVLALFIVDVLRYRAFVYFQ